MYEGGDIQGEKGILFDVSAAESGLFFLLSEEVVVLVRYFRCEFHVKLIWSAQPDKHLLLMMMNEYQGLERKTPFDAQPLYLQQQ